MVAALKQGRGSDSVDAEAIRRNNLGEVLELGIAGGDARRVRLALIDAMENATMSVRVRIPGEPMGHEERPDHGVRIAAARVLAEIIGLIPRAGAVNLSLTDNSIRITLDQQLTEIQSLGVGSAELLGELREVVDRAQAALPAPSVPNGVEVVE